jgi:hypothetical protein
VKYAEILGKRQGNFLRRGGFKPEHGTMRDYIVRVREGQGSVTGGMEQAGRDKREDPSRQGFC